MRFVSDPEIAIKIERMKERVRWKHSTIQERGIDQTRFVLHDENSDSPDFSFLVIGDTGSGNDRGKNAQRRVAEHMLKQSEGCRFVLHTGDVVYLVGSSEQYPDNFIHPYREFLLGGDRPDDIPYDRMVFTRPILPVLGNHDYYDLPLVYGAAVQLFAPVGRLLRHKIDLDLGWHGSYQGDAYARAFLDYLKPLSRPQLEAHLDRHYTAKVASGRCLRYEPGEFTRLPNRYYAFRRGGIDFFALDSNTFNAPEPVPDWSDREALLSKRAQLERQKQCLMDESATLNPEVPDDAQQLNDIRGKFEQIDEEVNDINKRLTRTTRVATVDVEQLSWLRQGLIDSWRDPEVRGRILYFHHPPYITEATKWHQGQTLAVRRRLRAVFDAAWQVIEEKAGDRLSHDGSKRPIVDLILNGHAHCLDYVRTEDTGHADSFLNCLVCGGSGYSLRRQRQEGPDLPEDVDGAGERLVARSHLYVGRHGHGSDKHRPYSFLRIDVHAGTPPRFTVRPFVSEQFHHHWHDRALDPFEL